VPIDTSAIRGERVVAEFKDLIFKLLDCLDNVGNDYVIVGGFAAIIRGRARTTTDIDIIVDRSPELVLLLLDCLAQNGLDVMKEQARMAMAEGSTITILDTASYARVDLKLAKTKDELEVLSTAIAESYENRVIKVATIEEILFGKLLYMGPIDDITDEEILNYADALDFFVLYDQYKNALDMQLLARKIKQHHLEASFAKLTNFHPA
jgi:predicted nucleotidyltransferase